MDRRILAAGALVLIGALSACSGSGSAAAPKTITRTVTATATTTVTETAEASPDTTDAANSTEYTPTKSDFTVGVKILSKECFGTAGCNIEFRLQPAYTGDVFDSDQTVEVTYEIVGSEDEYSNTFTMTGDTNASVNERESVQTGPVGKISAKITEVELVNFSE